MLPQFQALKVRVADKREGKHETDSDVMPAYNIGEGSPPRGGVTRPLRADSRERPAPYSLAMQARLSLLGLKAEVSRGEDDDDEVAAYRP